MLILVFGASAVLLRQRTPDFLGEDAFYADAAQSLLHHGFYGVNGVPETTQPPGLPAILALMFSIFGYSYSVSVGAIAVFETLGFLLNYEFLQRRIPLLVAGAICILLLSSPLYFGWATRTVYPSFAYFFTTMLALLSWDEVDKASTTRSTIIWGTIFTIAVASSLMIATGTMALLGAMVAAVAFSLFKDRRLGRIRLLKFLPAFLVGITVLGLWMHQKPAPLEWSLPGYPGSYLQQIKLKHGNHPELGMAKWSDIPARFATNLLAESDMLSEFVTRHGVNQTKVAVVIVPVLLIVIGWTYSLWKNRGTELVDWYFAGYQLIYLLWPWTMESRYFLPIVPLACFYIWRGIEGVLVVSKARPRVAGIVWLPAALLLSFSGVRAIYLHLLRGDGDWGDKLMVALWLISAGCAAWMAWTGKSIFSFDSFSKARIWLNQPLSDWRPGFLKLLRYASILAVSALVLIGIATEIQMARENLNVKEFINVGETGISEILAQEIEAGIWLRSNTAPDSVIMARHWPTVRHYADRKLVWFAPISDPDTLFEGIVRHDVDYVVVVKHPGPYYLPDDDYCFDRLLSARKEYFRPVLLAGNMRIYKVERNPDPEFFAPDR
jgi:hypothetical protein